MSQISLENCEYNYRRIKEYHNSHECMYIRMYVCMYVCVYVYLGPVHSSVLQGPDGKRICQFVVLGYGFHLINQSLQSFADAGDFVRD